MAGSISDSVAYKRSTDVFCMPRDENLCGVSFLRFLLAGIALMGLFLIASLSSAKSLNLLAVPHMSGS